MSATLRAKFRCTCVKKTSYCQPDGKYSQEQEEVQLSAVSGTPNEQWSKWTPAGQLTMTINNPEAQGKLKNGQCYYIDFIEAPEKDE